MSDNFRILCAELVAAFDSYHLFADAETTTAWQHAERVNQAITAAVAALKAEPEGPANPSGYAYRYHDYSGSTYIKFNGGGEVNGSSPIEAVPYWFAPPSVPTTPPAPETPAEALAARPLLEQVAAMADCIGAQTVGQITAISNRAAAWLRANPPGQPVAIEPRGCPTPGACSCVEPTPPAPEVGELSTDFRSLCAAMLSWWGLLALPECARPQDQALFDELGRLARAALKAEPVATPATQELDGDRVQKLAAIIREADPARLPRAWSHQFAQALLAHPGFSGCCDGPAAPPAPQAGEGEA